MSEILWKCLVEGMKSSKGDLDAWKPGVKKEESLPLVWCEHGFHASRTPLEAISWVWPVYIVEVEVDGEKIESKAGLYPHKSCHQGMRPLHVWEIGEEFWQDTPEDLRKWRQARVAVQQARATWRQADAAREQADAAWEQADAAREQADAACRQAYDDIDKPAANAWIIAKVRATKPTRPK